MKAKRKRRKPSRRPLGIKLVITAAVAAAGILLYRAGRPVEEDASVQKNDARLREMEESDITALEDSWKGMTSVKNEGSQKTAGEIQESIISGNVLSDVAIRQAFKGTVILGDSITESIVEYGYLDTDVVVSERGMSVSNADDLISTAISMNPSVIFMAFGSNDLELYGENAQGFVDGYRVQVQKLQEAFPNVPIYINLVLPLTNDAINNTPDLQYYPQYNEELRTMCTDMGLTPVDNSFILRNNPTLYEPDGEHVTSEYYPQWLTSMAEMAGLA